MTPIAACRGDILMMMRSALVVALVLVGTGLAHATVSGSPVDVGQVAVGASRAAADTLSSDLGDHIDHFDRSGANCGLFTIAPTSGDITAGGTLAITVTFSPLARGAVTCTIVTFSDATTVNGQFAVSGTGVAPIATIAPPTSLDFGAVRVTGATSTQTFEVTNTGDTGENLVVPQPTFTGDFGLVSPLGTQTIAPGTTVPYVVAFDPSAAGPRTGSITFASNDPVTPSQVFALTGTGTTAIVETADVDVGTVLAGQSVAGTVAITNAGTVALTVASATISGGSWFTFDDHGCTGQRACTLGIAVPPELDLAVRCSPAITDHGMQVATVTIASDTDPGGKTTAMMMCVAQSGAIAAAPSPLAFGGVVIATTATKSFTLSNPGNLDIVGLAGAIAPSAGYAIDPATPLPVTLPANSSQSITIDFSPLATTDGGPATLSLTGMWGTTPVTASLALTGTPLTIDLAVAPATVDFGSFEYDTTPTATFCMTNPSQAPVNITAVMIDATGSTMSTEFAVTKIVKQTACGTGGATQVLPYDVAPGEVLQVTIRAQPANRAGALTANAVVMTTMPLNPTRTVMLTGTATTGVLAVTPGLTVDFGGVDVDTGPVTQTVTLANQGDGAVTLSAFAKSNAKFTVTLPGTTTLMPGDTLPIMVTYDPSVVAQDTMTITHAIQHSVTQMTETITFTGNGTDRVLAVPQLVVTAPDTFRNPGSKAPVLPVDVMNAGGAPLHISAAMIDTTDAWTLLDTAPIVVAAGETHHFMVKFAPMVAGMIPDAHLVVTTDAGDPPNLTKTASIALRGMGLDRRATIGPQPIDVGFTGVGVPLTATDILAITSMDDANTYEIRQLQLADTTAFAIDDPPMDVALAPAATETYSVTFTPLAEGDFSTTISLFLDEDTVAQNTTTITGHAVTLDVHGSGGCSAGGGSGGWLLVAIVLGVTLRRRAVLVMLAIPTAAHADDVDLTIFAPTPQIAGNAFHVQSAEVGKSGDYVIQTVVSYASNPLVIDATQGGMAVSSDRVVKQSTLFDLGAAFAFLGRFEAGVRMPLYSQSGDAFDPKLAGGMPGPSGTARGDLSVNAKARLVGAHGFAFGLGGTVSLPTASKGELTGSTNPVVHALALATLTAIPRLTLTGNAGAVIRQVTKYDLVEQRSGFAWGGGASLRITDEIWATAEVFGELASGATAHMTAIAPTEALAGGNFHIGTVTLGLALGRGITTSAGAPDLRGVLSLSFSPVAQAPIHPAIPAALDGDADGDGIPDSLDKCPNEPEDKDMFEDQDGCPDPDNDHDGIPDAKDKCPLDPEDFDGFQDADGCPDKDNDGDGIPDELDKCPNVPEDKDGFQDLDGCPDPDNDNDGIPDEKDKCPNEPETINGFQDDDGCPDAGSGVVVLSPDRVDTLEAVQFVRGTTFTKASANVLAQIGATLRAHIEITRVRVAVHVQPTSEPDKDLQLSNERARAVVAWLVKYGIAQTRLDPRGFGGTVPLVAAKQKNAAQINDRLELVIMERK